MRQGFRTKRCLSAPSFCLPLHGLVPFIFGPPEAHGLAAWIGMLITNMLEALGGGGRASFIWTYKNTALRSGRRETWRSAHLCSDTEVWGPQGSGIWGAEDSSKGVAVKRPGFRSWLCHLTGCDASQGLSIYQLYKMGMTQPRYIMRTGCAHVTWHVPGVYSVSLSAYLTDADHLCAWNYYEDFII